MGHFLVNGTKVIPNTVTQEGLKEAFRIFLTNGDPLGELYLGLIENPAFSLSTDRFSDKNWTEHTNYTEKTRPVWNRAPVDGLSVPNLCNAPAAFTLQGDVNLMGFFLTDSPIKGGLVGNILAVSESLEEQYYEGDTLLLEYTWEF